jgi:hypothetical protein
MAFDNPTASGMQSPDIRPQAICDGTVLMDAAAKAHRVWSAGSLLLRCALMRLRPH